MSSSVQRTRKSKCYSCGESFEKEDLTTRNNKKYCKECLIKRDEEAIKKKEDWVLLFEYICELYKIDKPTGMMFKQLKDFRGEDYEYTDIGMFYTLKYYYDVLEHDVLEGGGLGIIPYYYDKAKQHYNRVYDLEDVANNFKMEEQIIKVKTRITNKKDFIKNPLPLKIDWEGINEED